jgi:CRISPR-associated endonuclease/helicase Cas3
MAGGPPVTLAHVDPASGRAHRLDEHLRAVGALAQGFAQAFAAGPWGFVAGLVHDLGKSSSAFQQRLQGSSEAVDHSTAGAQWLEKHLGPAGRLLAYAVAGHHGGLPNGTDETQRSLAARLDKVVPTWDRGLLGALDVPEVLGAFPIRPATGPRGAFQVGFLTRMVFSCLVDADFLDTERFFDFALGHQRGGYQSLTDLRGRLDAHLTQVTAGAEPSPVNEARAEVLAACRSGASLAPGLFSLTVPTGGGKTLASLAFALDHAQAHGLRRVIYAIPYTSIIEQTAAVFRGALGGDAVVEHHSNFDPIAGARGSDPLDPSDDNTRPDARRLRLASENWDAPIVVTTNVQFFESLFHGSIRVSQRHLADAVT